MTEIRPFPVVPIAQGLITRLISIARIEKHDKEDKIQHHIPASEVDKSKKAASLSFRVHGGLRLSGSIEVKTSKNAAVALICASLLNKGSTILRQIARIEEVNSMVRVLTSIGVEIHWMNGENDLQITPPERLRLADIDVEAACKTRSIILLLGPLLGQYSTFSLPHAGGCNLGIRTVEPHMASLRHFGLDVVSTDQYYQATVQSVVEKNRRIIFTERGDTVTENVLMAAAMRESITTIVNASPNYSIQDLCQFLQKLGVSILGKGTTTLVVKGRKHFNTSVDYSPSEDPIEVMSFIAAAIVTKSEITIKRAPIEFLEVELEILRQMGFIYAMTDEYLSRNGHTRLVDITTSACSLHSPVDKIHPQPFPGVNIDNLPFFVIIAAAASGRTLLHDWVYETRTVYLTELSKLNVSLELLDPHRMYITGPTKWKPAELVAPPALRPAVVILLAMLATLGMSVLHNASSILRGYEDLASRLTELGAEIEFVVC